MAYNNRNKYLKIIEVQKCFKEHYKPGISTIIGVYRSIIKPKYHISRNAFNMYLNTPAEKLLKELDEKENAENKAKAQQISMDFNEE